MKIAVIVHPNSKRPRLEDKAGTLHVYVSQPPVEGKANEAVIKAISKYFKVPQSNILLKSGAASKIKRLEII